MYKICIPQNPTLNNSTYLYNGGCYNVWFFETYWHLVNGLAATPTKLSHIQASGKDYYSTWADKTSPFYSKPPRVAKGIFVLDPEDKKVDIGLLRIDVGKWKHSHLTTGETLKFCQKITEAHALTNNVPNYFLSKQLLSYYRHKNANQAEPPEFRRDSIPDILIDYDWSASPYRSIRHMNELKQATALSVQDVLEFEEDSNQRICIKIRPSRNQSNLPDPWDLEPIRSDARSKSWKAKTKARKQWAKCKKCRAKSPERWDRMVDWLEANDCGDDSFDCVA